MAIGVATATAVITGALLVGDSMRGSLADLTIQRLGLTDSIVAPMAFFDSVGITKGDDRAIALIYFPTGIAESRVDSDSVNGAAKVIRRAGTVQIIGIDRDFWELDSLGMMPMEFPGFDRAGDDGVVINASAAAELNVRQGDLITIRLPAEQAVPADSPLGRRDATSEGLPRMKVVAVIEDRGLGRFSLSPSQAAPQNIYVSRAVIGELLDREGQANLLLFDREISTDDLNVGVDDLGLSLRRVTNKFEDTTVFDYYTLTSDRLLLPERVVDEVIREFGSDKVAPITTYLANAIERIDESGSVVASIPYSTITAMNSSKDVPLDFTIPASATLRRKSKAVPLVINSWASERLDAEIGTELRIAYYEPEVENGKEIERYLQAIVTEIVPITEPSRAYRRRSVAQFDQPPTIYNDPDFTPLVPGVTDQGSITDWDLPFQLQRKINRSDDDYWNKYRLTPKAFLPLTEGHRRFGSRFGDTTSLRIDTSAATDLESLRSKISDLLHPHLNDLGWDVIPIRRQQLEASKGTTPFDGLFLALSFFVIASAVLLIAMLLRLGLTERTEQMGTMMAMGWTPSRTRVAMMGEGVITSGLGAILGTVGGIAYGWCVLWALKTTWVGAVTVPFLTFHYSITSLVIGAVAGFATAMVTLWVTTRWLTKVSAQRLLGGGDVNIVSKSVTDTKATRIPWMSRGLAALALLLGCFGAVSGGQAAAGGFIGGGMMLMMASLLAIFHRLRTAGGANQFFKLGNVARLSEPTALSARRAAQQCGTLQSEKVIGPGTAGKSSSGAKNVAQLSKKQMMDRDAFGSGNRVTLTRLSFFNASRWPLRSTMTIGLMAVASFLIIAISAFRLQPSEGGTGGFELMARSAQPVFIDLQDAKARQETFGRSANDLDAMTIASMRLRIGQDASCNNLYQATKPTVIGVPAGFGDLISRRDSIVGFDWASHAKLPNNELSSTENSSIKTPWDNLSKQASGSESDPIPVVIDQNTAMWSLQMTGGVGQVKSFEYEAGQPIFFKVVGLLANSVLQGQLLIGEANFQRIFPNISGYQFFLFDAPANQADSVSALLESRLGDVGMDVSNSSDVLSGMLAVQNTYLRTFQSLGAIGLLLGTVGLAVAQFRSVIERRSELAVMRSMGFTRGRLSLMVMTETAALLAMGIGCGLLCAVLAVLPHAWFSDVRPPIIEPVLIVVGILIFGLVAGLLATRRISRMPLIDSLRAQ